MAQQTSSHSLGLKYLIVPLAADSKRPLSKVPKGRPLLEQNGFGRGCRFEVAYCSWLRAHCCWHPLLLVSAPCGPMDFIEVQIGAISTWIQGLVEVIYVGIEAGSSYIVVSY